jgi:deoxyribose-phosphate aldolase
MQSDDLVRQITAEVLRRLGGAGPGPTASAPGSASPARSGQAAAGQGTALVLLTGGDARLPQALEALQRIAAAHPVCRVVLSPTAQRVIGPPAVRRAAPSAELYLDGEPEALLQGVGAVYLPNLSLNAAGKIGRLTPDSLVCILAVRALLAGLPVCAAQDSLLPRGTDPGRVPPGVRTRLDELLAGLSGLGVRLCPTEALGAAAGAPAGPAAASRACAGAGDCAACGLCVEQKPEAVRALVDQGATRVGAALGARPASQGLAAYIDHTLLKPDATEVEIRALCEEARQHTFASVCVNPGWVKLAAELLRGSPVKVCTVIGFPLGATTPTAKAIETRDAIANGATEIDMVLNIGALKSGDDELVRRDIEGVVQAARGQGLVKVILETALLTREEKVKACLLAKMAGADFVKTSTGFSSGGATVEDIALMRETVGPEMGVKASGGIRDTKTAEAMVAAGATRIGASASVAIATGQKATGKGY